MIMTHTLHYHALFLFDGLLKTFWLLHESVLVLAIGDFVMVSQQVLVHILNLDPMDWSIFSLTWKSEIKGVHPEDEDNSSFENCSDVSWLLPREGAAQQSQELKHADAKVQVIILRFIFSLHIVAGISSRAILGKLDVIVPAMASLSLL